ncbi:MAG: hypothetical protein SGARI_002569 [Bacillariaceae sp.]
MTRVKFAAVFAVCFAAAVATQLLCNPLYTYLPDIPSPQCKFRPAIWNCPAFPTYTSGCILQSQEKLFAALRKGWKGLSIGELHDFVGYRAHEIHSKLQAYYNRRRVIMVGDSLMRQYYEATSCRLGLPITWYNVGANWADSLDPEKRLARVTNASGVKIVPFSKPPVGYTNVSGYSMSSTEVANDNDRIDYCGFETKLEYFKYDAWPKFHNMTKFFEALLANDFEDPSINKHLDKDPLIIVNLGIHSAAKLGRETYQSHVNKVMEACGAFNKNRGDDSSNKPKIQCIYRDIMPQHFQPRGPMKEFPPNWKYNFRETNGCGPHDPNQNSVNFVNFEEYYDMAASNNVPVIKILTNQFWKDAWNWHNNNDCTHFCMDPQLWDMLHLSFVELMEKEDPGGFMAL